MRKILSSDDVVLAWVTQSQPYAENRHGSLSFNGTELVSYSTRIGIIVPGVAGRAIALISKTKYSVTTSGQQSMAHVAVLRRGYPTFSVNYDALFDPTGATAVADLEAEVVECLRKAKRARENKPWHYASAQDLLNQITLARGLFGLPAPLTLEPMIAE